MGGRTRPSYPPAYTHQLVELVRTGWTPAEWARVFEVSAHSIRDWVRQADRDEGRRTDGLTAEERCELIRLRRKVKQLELERESLPWQAGETPALPGQVRTGGPRPHAR